MVYETISVFALTKNNPWNREKGHLLLGLRASSGRCISTHWHSTSESPIWVSYLGLSTLSCEFYIGILNIHYRLILKKMRVLITKPTVSYMVKMPITKCAYYITRSKVPFQYMDIYQCATFTDEYSKSPSLNKTCVIIFLGDWTCQEWALVHAGFPNRGVWQVCIQPAVWARVSTRL